MDVPANLQLEHDLWQKGIRYVAGVDEAGRGPLAGPVVAAAVVFEPYVYHPEVRDSKKLSPARREVLFQWIQEHALAVGIGVVGPAEIDRLNIRQATFQAMRKAIGALRPPPQFLLLDGEPLPEKILPQKAFHQGESLSFTIACASIVAKVHRDRLMLEAHEQYPRYGFDQHKGYGTALHRERILQYGPCPIHRRSFLRKILPRDE